MLRGPRKGVNYSAGQWGELARERFQEKVTFPRDPERRVEVYQLEVGEGEAESVRAEGAAGGKARGAGSRGQGQWAFCREGEEMRD